MPRDPELQRLARRVLIEVWVIDCIDQGRCDGVYERPYDGIDALRDGVLDAAGRALRAFGAAVRAYDARHP